MLPSQQVTVREMLWKAHQNGEGLDLTAEQAHDLWESILQRASDDIKRRDQEHRANIARLDLLAKDADGKASDNPFPEERNYLVGFHDGLKRAIRVLEGQG